MIRKQPLVHACPYSSVEKIIEEAFDHDRIGRNGKQDEKQNFGCIFIGFSSRYSLWS